jgi:hypothetical protein
VIESEAFGVGGRYKKHVVDYNRVQKDEELVI